MVVDLRGVDPEERVRVDEGDAAVAEGQSVRDGGQLAVRRPPRALRRVRAPAAGVVALVKCIVVV